MPIRVTVWGENVHEQDNEAVAAIYPEGMHAAIASLISQDPEVAASTVTLQDPEHGLSEQKLNETDVLVWWGHAAHELVADEIAARVQRHVWEGMGLIVLHSGHHSKPFKRLMGTPANLAWREAGERERLWVVNPGHPIAKGLPPYFELENEEMYGEPFTVPEPLETVFISWFQGGEVFRSGLTYRRGAGNIFYFRPGHETYPTYHDATVGQVLRNAVRWAHNAERHAELLKTLNRKIEQAIEPITERGARLRSHEQRAAGERAEPSSGKT
ncbi:MAG TPA: trehalose utilization protein ThuA [Alphaproteobacteria bacterium]|nr:trehalose utilization protein ThuA [Alphaproteobacteria bacterium]